MPNDIYLSSTLDDLQAERDAARDVLGKQGFGIKDSYQASEKDLIASCLEDVAKCAIYVCIIGMRYGYRPDHTIANLHDKSITQLEFEEAVRLNLPCFAFVKSDRANYQPAFLDSHTKENDAGKRVETFRGWIGTQADIRPTQFESIQELREKVLAAILSYQHRKAGAPANILVSDTRHRAELTADLGLVLPPGVHEAVLDAFRRQIQQDTQDRRFKRIDLVADDPQFLAKLDEQARDCRALCWLLTPGSVQSYKDNPGVLATAIRHQRRRRGDVGVLLAGGATTASLPAEWDFGVSVEADPLPAAALNEVHRALRARVRTIRLDRRIAVPCFVFAMTRNEAQQLAADGLLMASIADPAERALREAQVARMLAVIRRPEVQQAWPDRSYADRREDWRPFGPDAPTAQEYLTQAVERINEGDPSKRERLFIKGGTNENRLHLQLLPYVLDEVTEDFRGSRDAVLKVFDRGCVALVDEMALLHPALRPWAKLLLKGENMAVLSSQPADPAPYPVSTVLSNDSALQVGSLMARFRDEHDPRCELAINSPQRLQRWLRLVLPELVPTLGGEEVQTALVKLPDEALFGKKVPM